jgi:tRNA A37 N6-isopentenylltransferase MiaA
LIVEKTMQLAKKQKTWFKRDAEIQFLPPSDAVPRAEEILRGFLDSRA